MLKMLFTTIILAVLFPAYTLAYLIATVGNLKDADLMESPLDFLTMSIDEYYNATAEARYFAKLTRKITDFYKSAIFIPQPSYIDLTDKECVLKVADDVTLFGNDKQLVEELLNLID